MRLTETIKDKIVHAMDKAMFAKREEAIEKKLASLGDRIYKALFSESDRKRMEALPQGWLQEDGHVYVSFAQNPDAKDGDRPLRARLPMSAPRRVTYAFSNSWGSAKEFGWGTFAERYFAIDKERESLSQERRNKALAAHQVLDSVTTDKQLLTVWPEAKAYLPEQVTKQGVSKALELLR